MAIAVSGPRHGDEFLRGGSGPEPIFAREERALERSSVGIETLARIY